MLPDLEREPLAHRSRLPQFLWLNSAITRLCGDLVDADPAVFRIGAADIRYVVERYLYFALVADPRLHEHFVAWETRGILLGQAQFSNWAAMIAPYLPGRQRSVARAPNLRQRMLRSLHRRYGRALIRSDGSNGRPRVLFLVIQPKFARYFAPIASGLSKPYAFLVVDDAAVYDALEDINVPRIHVALTAGSIAMTRPAVKIGPVTYQPGVFESWVVRYNAIRRALATIRPDCIVIPEGNAPIGELVNQCAKTLAIPTLCLQQGWAPITHVGFRNMSYSRMCVWGDGFAELLSADNPRQSFAVTGNHNIKSRLQGDLTSRRSIGFFLQNGAHWITPPTWRSTLELIRWTAETWPAYEVRVRPHPGAALTETDLARFMGPPNIRIMPAGEFSLDDVLRSCRVTVAMNSTTILESVATGGVPVILDVNGWGPYCPNIAAAGAAIEVTDFEMAKRAVRQLVSDDGYCSSFAAPMERVGHRFIRRSGADAIAATLAELHDLIDLRGGARRCRR